MAHNAASNEKRSESGCVACGEPRLSGQWTLTSTFFAKRALLSEPEVISLLRCTVCGTHFFDIMVSEQQLARLYHEYRGEAYFKLRNGLEPWYTRELNSGMGSGEEVDKRIRAMHGLLSRAGVTARFESALDYGGDRGQMLRGVDAGRKAVFEISGIAAEPGIELIGESAMRSGRWGFILSCHVLEHLTFPARHVTELISLGHGGTLYFFEIPCEPVRSSKFNSTVLQRKWLKWLAVQPRLLQGFDFLSCGFRARLGVVLPLLFFPLREHLTFFTLRGMTAMLRNRGLTVLRAEVLETGHMGVIAVQSNTPDVRNLSGGESR